jgi:hypothetical protein
MLVHLDGDGIASLKSTFSGCLGRVDVTLSMISCSSGDIQASLTLQRGACVVLNRTVGRGKPGTSALQIFAVLPELLPCSMCVGQRNDRGESCYGLHVVVWYNE